MAEEKTEQRLDFPPPPSFYKLYKEDDGQGPLPPEPPPPVEGEYVTFGVAYHTQPSLPKLGCRQLYSTREDGSIDYKAELKSLNNAAMEHYKRMLDDLADRPSQFHKSFEQLGLTLRNMVYLLNLMRPYQARATLAHALRLEVASKESALARLRACSSTSREKLTKRAQELHAATCCSMGRSSAAAAARTTPSAADAGALPSDMALGASDQAPTPVDAAQTRTPLDTAAPTPLGGMQPPESPWGATTPGAATPMAVDEAE